MVLGHQQFTTTFIFHLAAFRRPHELDGAENRIDVLSPVLIFVRAYTFWMINILMATHRQNGNGRNAVQPSPSSLIHW